MKKVTIQDVAKELNLSRNTVAKALNNSDTVAYETRYIVIKKAYEMGYSKLLPVVLNEFKVVEHKGSEKTIVVLARKELSTFWNRIIMGISDELNKNNCRLEFNFISRTEERDLTVPEELPSKANGVILLSVFNGEYVKKVVSFGKPIVFLDAPQDSSKASIYGDVVLFEGINSVRRMTEQVIAEGARKLAFIGDITYCRSIYERFCGFTHAVRQAGLEENHALFKVSRMPKHYYDKVEVEDAIEEFPYLPDAIICANDDIACAVMSYLKEKEIAVPSEVMVTGFDNKDETAFLTPSLTTAFISNQRMGKRLVQQMLFRIENPEMPYEVITVNTEVVYRESSTRHK